MSHFRPSGSKIGSRVPEEVHFSTRKHPIKGPLGIKYLPSILKGVSTFRTCAALKLVPVVIGDEFERECCQKSTG
jgi:hypothetical protein